MYAGIETGGTKILARVVAEDGAVLADARFPTTTPAAALADLQRFLSSAVAPGARLAGMGIAGFGPLRLDPGRADYGELVRTPKPGWSGFNLRAALAERFGVPVSIDTDVNAAALAEQRTGAARGLERVAYVTVGTGIGAGLALAGTTLAAPAHPEMGHVALQRDPADASPSTCPYHPQCAEGLAAGPSIARRLQALTTQSGSGPRDLATAPAVRTLIARYLGQLAATLVMAWAPQRIVWGGGVMGTPGLVAEVQAALVESLGGYGTLDVAAPGYCVGAALQHAGLEGALLMARDTAGTRPPVIPLA